MQVIASFMLVTVLHLAYASVRELHAEAHAAGVVIICASAEAGVSDNAGVAPWMWGRRTDEREEEGSDEHCW